MRKTGLFTKVKAYFSWKLSFFRRKSSNADIYISIMLINNQKVVRRRLFAWEHRNVDDMLLHMSEYTQHRIYIRLKCAYQMSWQIIW